ncbi:hypothetical protein V1511DRAFT_486064 [Dipodascopsis uninucleata]
MQFYDAAGPGGAHPSSSPQPRIDAMASPLEQAQSLHIHQHSPQQHQYQPSVSQSQLSYYAPAYDHHRLYSQPMSALPPPPPPGSVLQATIPGQHLSVAAAQVAAAVADVTLPKPTKEIKRRTKTGCLTCRKRRIKCDERHPICNNCSKSKRVCLGYDPIFKRVKGDDKDKATDSDANNGSGSSSNSNSKSGEDKDSKKEDSAETDVKRIKIDSLLTE